MGKTLKDASQFPGETGARDAALAASNYFREIAGYTGQLSLEETEFDKTKKMWNITLGYLENPDTAFLAGLQTKAYKVFTVDSTGQVISMKVRRF